MLLALFIGFLLGIITSVPIGAVGQLMINRLMREGFRASFAVGLFSALLDALYSEIALIGISIIIGSAEIRSLVQGIGLLVLLYGGLRSFIIPQQSSLPSERTAALYRENPNQSWISHVKYFLFLVMAAVSNPTALAFWVNMAHVLHSSVLKGMGIWEYTLFSLSIGLGSAFCQYVVLRIARDVRLFHSPTRRMIIQWLSTSIFMLTISYFIYHFIQELLLNTI